jgi:pyridoxal phosphate enzyme (YggS family)
LWFGLQTKPQQWGPRLNFDGPSCGRYPSGTEQPLAIGTHPERPLLSRLRERLARVEERLTAACRRAGRPRADVTLIAVTKTVSAEVAALLLELGVLDLGENRPQELWRKAAVLPATVRWHLIGHLQRNKIERTLPLVHCIHAVDSVRLLEALEQEAARRERSLPVLLEVNASGEASKHGFAPAEVPALDETLAGLKHLRVAGLMTMAAHEEDPERCRPTFVLLRSLRDRLQERVGTRHRLEYLSMGMSNDFEVAVEEGANMVRLGSVLFEGMGP